MGADYVTLRDRIDELVAQHGTLRAAARVLMTDAAYLHRLRAGEKTEPGDPLLRRMGLREVRLYERAAGVATRHPRCGYPYCACVGECFAASQPGGAPGVEGKGNA